MTMNELFRRILFTLKRRQMDRELAEEMREHLKLKTEKNLAAGMAAEEARYAAQRQLGNLTRMEEESRRTWGFPFLESLLQDIRYSMPGLRAGGNRYTGSGNRRDHSHLQRDQHCSAASAAIQGFAADCAYSDPHAHVS
jgi:hypothetical protein